MRGWPYWNTSSTAVSETTAPSETNQLAVRQPRHLQRLCQRIGGLQLLIRHQPGRHQADDDVDQRADRQPARMPIGMLRWGFFVSSAAVEMASKPM